MTSKERAQLKAQAMKLDSIFQIGKSSLTPQVVNAIGDALRARELIKISVLKNCMDDPGELAILVSERTGSQVVQVIGKKIILYKQNVEKGERKKRTGRTQLGKAVKGKPSLSAGRNKKGRYGKSRDYGRDI